MQNALLAPSPAPLPFFACAIPPECQWRDLAVREPHQRPARDLLRALTEAQAGGEA